MDSQETAERIADLESQVERLTAKLEREIRAKRNWRARAQGGSNQTKQRWEIRAGYTGYREMLWVDLGADPEDAQAALVEALAICQKHQDETDIRTELARIVATDTGWQAELARQMTVDQSEVLALALDGV